MSMWMCKGHQLFFQCSAAGFWTPLHARRDHDQVLSSSIMLHHSLLLILLCICYVKRVLSASGTHCWSWGCRWHLTARRASSQSLPLWTASTEEIHLRQNILSLSPLKSAGIRSLSLSLSRPTGTQHTIRLLPFLQGFIAIKCVYI